MFRPVCDDYSGSICLKKPVTPVLSKRSEPAQRQSNNFMSEVLSDTSILRSVLMALALRLVDQRISAPAPSRTRPERYAPYGIDPGIRDAGRHPSPNRANFLFADDALGMLKVGRFGSLGVIRRLAFRPPPSDPRSEAAGW